MQPRRAEQAGARQENGTDEGGGPEEEAQQRVAAEVKAERVSSVAATSRAEGWCGGISGVGREGS